MSFDTFNQKYETKAREIFDEDERYFHSFDRFGASNLSWEELEVV